MRDDVPPGKVTGARSEDDAERSEDGGGGGTDSLGTNELVGIGRGVVVAEDDESLVMDARGMAEDIGPMRAVVGAGSRGVVGGGVVDGVVGIEGARVGGIEARRVGGDEPVEDNVVVPGILRVEGTGCFLREARPN